MDYTKKAVQAALDEIFKDELGIDTFLAQNQFTLIHIGALQAYHLIERINHDLEIEITYPEFVDFQHTGITSATLTAFVLQHVKRKVIEYEN